VVLLKALGYRVTAVSGRESTHDYLRQLGADAILPRSDFAETRPLEKQLWAGAVDTVGGPVLAKVLAQRNIAAASPPAVWPGASICRPP
jgi:acrylyl-CoA reductase (NADPH)